MKLAEALALRADASRRVEQRRARITGSARYQEGEPPAEDAAALLVEAGAVLDELESLIRRINRTNAATQVEGGTLTDALARRDALRLRHGVITSHAQHGAQVTGYAARHTTGCRSAMARAGKGHSASRAGGTLPRWRAVAVRRG